ncbi:hypothetical protein ACHAWF_016126 [Thalassiosira exigua]
MALLPHYFCLFFALVVFPRASANGYGDHGHHGSRRYAAYDYDLTTPQYTPDGRLLQVEYATNACIRGVSNPIVSVGLSIPDDGETVLIMATVSSPPEPPSSSSSSVVARPMSTGPDTDQQTDKRDEKEIDLMAKESHQRAQFRIVEVPLSASNQDSSLQHPGTSSILIGLSGLLADATSLLNIAYSHLEEEQLVFGWHRLGLSPVGTGDIRNTLSAKSSTQLPSFTPRKVSKLIATQPSETALRLSRAIADECQKHAFGGGLRPFGASLLLVGVDPCNDTAEGGSNTAPQPMSRISMCETHPNGGWRSIVSMTTNEDMCKLGSQEIAFPQIMVSGGPARSQHELKRLIETELRQLYERQCSSVDANDPKGKNSVSIRLNDEGHSGNVQFLRKALQAIVSSLIEDWRRRSSPLSSSSKSLSNMEHDRDCSKMQLPQIEIVMSSSKRGTIRLCESDVVRLMKDS